MTARIEKTVFISYRRTNLPCALAICQDLHHNGYDVFFDYLSIESGNFEKVIIENIKTRAHFVVILTPSALERCKRPGDWLRREIETAMDEKRNIVPLLLESFDFGSTSVVQALTGRLATLNQYNGLRVPSEYFLEAMDRLRDRYLGVALSDITLPSLKGEAVEITETQKTAASEAPSVKKDQLTAQEWFERGYVFVESKNFTEAIRCFTEAIKLRSDDAFSYINRGSAKGETGDEDGAIEDYNEAIRLVPDDADAYYGRALSRSNKGDVDGALADFNKAINLKPDYADAYFNRARTRGTNDLKGKLADYDNVIHLQPDYPDVYYNRALIWEKKRSYSSAITDYQKYLDLGGGERDGDQKEVEKIIKKLKSRLTKKKSAKRSKYKGVDYPLLLLLVPPLPYLNLWIRQLLFPRGKHLHRARLVVCHSEGAYLATEESLTIMNRDPSRNLS